MKNRPAFTLLELVMAITVMGILASVAIPRLNRDLTQEAADNVLASIRYTQHLALLDDKHKFDKAKWQRRFWRIYFGTCEDKPYYAIGTDDDMGGSSNGRVDLNESAIDPANGKQMWAHDGATCEGSHTLSDLSPNDFIGKKYGIVKGSPTPSGGCTNKYIGFDHLGRPYNSGFVNSSTPDNAGRITSECILTFTLTNGKTFAIKIEPETGYAFIDGQPDS